MKKGNGEGSFGMIEIRGKKKEYMKGHITEEEKKNKGKWEGQKGK